MPNSLPLPIDWMLPLLTAVGTLVAARVGVSLTRLVRDLAWREGWLDAVVGRSMHRRPVPRVGGLAVAGAFGAGLCFFAAAGWLWPDLATWIRVPGPGVLAGALLMLGVGFWDDRRGMSALLKLGCQGLAALLVVADGLRFQCCFVSEAAVGGQADWILIPLTVLWVVGVINAINLIDGMDGLAAGVSVLVVGTLNALLALTGPGPDFVMAASLGGALLGFLVYNYHPASIFLGDSGSHFIGFLLAAFALPASHQPQLFWAALVPCLALGLPILDVSLAFLRRILQGRSPFAADREHIHHRIADRMRRVGREYRDGIWRLYLLCAGFQVSALLIVSGNRLLAALGVVLALGLIGLILVLLRFLRPASPPPATSRPLSAIPS